MNRTTKIILGIIAGLVVVCSACAVAGILLFSISSRTVGRSIQSSSANVAQASADIAEYDLPAGFGLEYGMEAGVFSMVAYTGEDGHSHIYFFQLPASLNLDAAQMWDRMQQTQQNGNVPAELKMVETKTGVIRGQEVQLVVSEL